MARDALLRLLRQRLRWLLALALLLPLAQVATTAHAITHGAEGSRQVEAKAHLQHCPLCTAAAVLGGHALPGSAAPAVFDTGRDVHARALLPATVTPAARRPANRGPPTLPT